MLNLLISPKVGGPSGLLRQWVPREYILACPLEDGMLCGDACTLSADRESTAEPFQWDEWLSECQSEVR